MVKKEWKIKCLVTEIVTLRIWVETNPGHDYWRKFTKVCQADLDSKDFCFICWNIWHRSKGKFIFFLNKKVKSLKHNFRLTFHSNISMKTEIKVSPSNLGPFPSKTMSWICFYSNSKCHNLSNKTSCFFWKNPDTPGSRQQTYFF